MSITLSDIIAQVNAELQNVTVRGSAEATADGETASFLVAPLGFTIIDDNTFEVALDGTPLTETTQYTMDFVNGICTLVSTPIDGQVLSWQFNYVAFTEEIITNAINAGIQNLFPSIYVADASVIATDGESFEYELPAGTEFVTRVEWRASATDSWITKRRARWELSRSIEDVYMKFFTAPSSGYIRVHTIARPAAVTDESDELPSRAASALVSYACYYLLVQKMAPRVRSDIAIATQGTGNVYPIQMNQAAQAFLMRYQFQLASVKMPPWSAI